MNKQIFVFSQFFVQLKLPCNSPSLCYIFSLCSSCRSFLSGNKMDNKRISRNCLAIWAMLYKLKNFKPSEEREMRPGEIKPASAEHSRTYVNVYEGDFVADHALDRLWWTSSQTVTGSDREVWWKANLDQIYCVETVFFWLDNNRDNPMKWSCTDTGCVCLVGGCSAHSLVILPGKNSLSVSFEGALPDGLPSTSDCQYGDTVKLQRESFKAYGILLFEVSIVGNSTGKQGELTFHHTLFKHHYEYLISIEMKLPYVV